jgi:tRNA A37 threonylcarbamoyladenosine dehydratase
MIDRPAIIGCGTVGASLAYKLARSSSVGDLQLFDFDVVSDYSEEQSYPFVDGQGGIHKVNIVSFKSKCINPNMTVETFIQKVTQPLQQSRFVIDCRDCLLKLLRL